MPLFERHIGIDYSGAETAERGLKGLRVFESVRGRMPVEVGTIEPGKRHWSRRAIAHWLAAELAEGPPTIVGIDHAFSFPLAYFEKHRLALDWPAFLDDFQAHWPTDHAHTYVDFVRDGMRGNGAARTGSPRWRRLTETLCGAKSPFHFDVPGSVAKSTHSGLPWLRFLRQQLGSRVHFWPFDGWDPPPGRSVILEAYPSLWSRDVPSGDRDAHQHDAWSIALWLAAQDTAGHLPRYFRPGPAAHAAARAQIEGWILGVGAAGGHPPVGA